MTEPGRRALVVAAIAVVAASACSSSGSGGAGPSDASAGPSLRRDVIPVLSSQCATAPCHGTQQASIGFTLTSSDPAAVRAALFADSVIARGKKLVVPGDPAASFLVAKIDGNADDFASACPAGGCGETMPPGTKLSPDERDAIRAWIAAGANDD